MTSSDEPRRSPAAERRRALAQRVAVVPADPSVNFVPGRVLVRGTAVKRIEELERKNPRRSDDEPLRFEKEKDDEGFDQRAANEGEGWIGGTVSPVVDAVALVQLLRAEGLDAQLEHVFFAHGCDPCLSAVHPSVAFGSLDPLPWRANPHGANPHGANPHGANPHGANPHGANPHGANPHGANPHGPNNLMSSAVPALERHFPVRHLKGPGAHPRITVLDTGLAGSDPESSPGSASQLPTLLADAVGPPQPAGQAGDPRITGDPDLPDATIKLDGAASYPADGWLDPVAGHGTFIAGLIEQLAPGCKILVKHVIGPLGDAREACVYRAIRNEAMKSAAERPDILSMSFGGRVLEEAPVLREAVAAAKLAGIVVVASAGNDGSPVPQFPAGFDDVVAVGAIGPDGPAPWTNYGEWVDACAPGVDLVSAFFAAFNGPEEMINGLDCDDFHEWAIWSGTSFSAPVVVAALAREMVLGDCSAADAVERVVRAPHLLRIPCLGTVVNV